MTTTTAATRESGESPPFVIEFRHVKEAAKRIQGLARETPLLTNSDLDELANRRLFFKVEAMQRTGSFKFRGALNATLELLERLETQKDPTEQVLQVITHSSGNHAAALACAAQVAASKSSSWKVQATIVMPENAPLVKKRAVEALGGTIVSVESTNEAREGKVDEMLAEAAEKKEPMYFIHPSENPRVIAGQGTTCLEWIREQMPSDIKLDVVIIPVGGGGLASGNTIALRGMLGKDVKIILAEPSELDDAKRSKDAGQLLKHDASNRLASVADGLKTTLGPNTWPIVRDLVDDIFLVTEEQILRATRLIWETLKVCIEPSAGVGVAVALYQEEFLQKYAAAQNVGIILCGGNVDIGKTVKTMEALGV